MTQSRIMPIRSRKSCCETSDANNPQEPWRYTDMTEVRAGPDWLIGSTGRIPGGPVCFFGLEDLCCHASGLNYAVPRLPALIAAPLFLFIIFSQPILLFHQTISVTNSQLITNHYFCANHCFSCERRAFEEGFKTKRNPLPAAPASQQVELALTAPFTVRFLTLQNPFGQLINHEPNIQHGRKTFNLPEGRHLSL